MLNERDSQGPFDVLDPPAGGLERLRHRIERHRRRRIRTRRIAAGTAGATAVVLALAVLLTGGGDPASRPDPGSDLVAIRLGLVDPPTEPVTVPPAHRHDFAVRWVPTTDDRVVFYWVGSR